MAYKSKRRVTSADADRQKQMKARGVMDRIRRRQRLILVILASALLVPFGAYGIMRQLMGPPERRAKGTAYGRTVTIREFQDIKRRMILGADIIRYRGAQAPRPDYPDDQVWDRYVLLHEAREMGLDVSPAEVESMLAVLFADADGAFDQEAFDQYLGAGRFPKPEEDVRQAVAEDLLVGGPLVNLRLLMAQYQQGQQGQRGYLPPSERVRLGPKLNRHLLSAIQISDDEVWAFFLDFRRTYEAEYLTVRAETFLDAVPDPTDDERQAWYVEHKDHTAADAEDGVGYYRPEQCKIHWFVAKVEDFKKKVKVTDEEIEAYYKANKERFRVTTQPSTQPTSAPATRPSTQPTSAPATQPSTQPTSAPATRPDTTPASRPTTGPTTTQAVTYRSLDEVEVQDEIRDTLAGGKAPLAGLKAVQRASDARDNAEEAVRKAAKERDGSKVPDEEMDQHVDYKVLAKDFGLTYHVTPGPVSARQAREIKGLGEAVSRSLKGRGVDGIFFGESQYAFADDLIDLESSTYHAWRTGWRKGGEWTYDEIRDRVDRDLRAYRAYELAEARATELLAELNGLPANTEAPLAAVAQAHGELNVDTSDALFLGSADYAPRRAGPDADEATLRSIREGVFARAIRATGLRQGQATVAGDPIARVQYLVRVTSRTDPELAAFRIMSYTYRSVALDQKRREFMQAWLEAVKKRADVKPEEEKPSEDDKDKKS